MSAIYDRFGGKAELLRYMHRQGAEDAVALVDALGPLGEDDGDLRDTRPQALAMGLEIIRRYRGRRRASLERMYDDPELAAIELDIQNGVVDACQRYLLAYRHQFDHPDPELAAFQAMRLLMAMVEQHESSLPTPNRGELSDEAFVAALQRRRGLPGLRGLPRPRGSAPTQAPDAGPRLRPAPSTAGTPDHDML